MSGPRIMTDREYKPDNFKAIFRKLSLQQVTDSTSDYNSNIKFMTPQKRPVSFIQPFKSNVSGGDR